MKTRHTSDSSRRRIPGKGEKEREGGGRKFTMIENSGSDLQSQPKQGIRTKNQLRVYVCTMA